MNKYKSNSMTANIISSEIISTSMFTFFCLKRLVSPITSRSLSTISLCSCLAHNKVGSLYKQQRYKRKKEK